jgi:2'-hydroxyisoflavone reductase
MKLLILGGTRFLGRHLAEQALQRGHDLTLLHRGRSGPTLFPEATHLLADRDGDLSVLDGGTWDAVIDTSAYVPRQVRAAAARLAGRVGNYQLVSTISVYSDFAGPGLNEDAPLARLADETTETVDGGTYGGLKALCEQAALDAYGERCLIARPGLLVGPHDPTGRFTWWATRLQRGGEVLAPGDPASPVQFIDARDAAAWLLLQAERQAAGTFNLTGPCRAAGDPLTMGEFLDTGRRVLNPDARLTWADEAFLLGEKVQPWSDLPVWVPRESAGLHQVDITRAVAAGLQCRPLAQTLADTAAWAATVPAPAGTDGPPRPAVGLAAERESDLLAALRAIAHTARPAPPADAGR